MRGTYDLIAYRVATRAAMEGYPVDYSVRCPDGTILCFSNDGDGGPDYLKGVKRGGRGKLVPANSDDHEREDALAAWCYAQPINVKFREDFEEKYGPSKRSRDEPSTDGDTSIWAEDAGALLEFRRTVLRTAKRTVCWTTPDAPTNLHYLQIPRGKKPTDSWRREAVAHIAKEYPGATVWGGVK